MKSKYVDPDWEVQIRKVQFKKLIGVGSDLLLNISCLRSFIKRVNYKHET